MNYNATDYYICKLEMLNMVLYYVVAECDVLLKRKLMPTYLCNVCG